MPGQTVNIDLCFVPTTRTADQVIPAVSGSSGRLIVQAPPSARSTTFPGAVFATPDQPYAEQMRAYTAAANHRYGWRSKPTTVPDPIRQQRIEPRHHAKLLQAARRATRLQRAEEDRAWMQLLATRGTVADRQRQYQHTIDRAMTPAQRRVARQRMWEAQRADKQQNEVLRAHRRQVLQQRTQEDQVWQAEQRRLRDAIQKTVVTTTWYAILLITDNCTRVCYGLPLLCDGPNVTSDQVVAALQDQLPASVAFVISDRGVHFTAHAFRAFTRTQGFLHVPISRRRPQTNGIAERMVRTLKEWLREQTWQSAAELDTLLGAFVVDYNDRPHQGRGLDGLSPAVYTQRLLSPMGSAEGI
ncbi:integrase core domain-containing protein [Herpetosiphon llansteffanensis]|uniref:integrase core domain-containing protein n=1 Tax=Herpetosiphon llansteffanensis TaxID=2094568 RepID=UPI0013DF5801|nr:integrase core domain-containing protein [Herpetosiphon llansteffanensis]